MTFRLAALTSHPIQYQAPLFKAVAAHPDVQLKVFFCSKRGLTTAHDPGFGTSVKWDIPLLEGYEHEFLKNLSPDPGSHHYTGLFNPSAPLKLLTWKPDVVLLHGYTHLTTHLVIPSLRALGVPLLLRSESTLLTPRSRARRLAKSIVLRPLIRCFTGGVATGRASASYLKHYGLPAEHVTVAPYSVDNRRFRESAAVTAAAARIWRENTGIDADGTVVLFVGKLVEHKGCHDLLAAFLRRARPKTFLVFVGEGRERARLEAAAAMELNKSVFFRGFVNQALLPEAYATGDLLVLPSRHEPWGLVVNEAMNMGLPVLVSDRVGSGHDLVDDETGWVFPAGDIDELDTALTAALSSRQALRQRGEAAQRRIASWGIEETCQALVHAARKAIR